MYGFQIEEEILLREAVKAYFLKSTMERAEITITERDDISYKVEKYHSINAFQDIEHYIDKFRNCLLLPRREVSEMYILDEDTSRLNIFLLPDNFNCMRNKYEKYVQFISNNRVSLINKFVKKINLVVFTNVREKFTFLYYKSTSLVYVNMKNRSLKFQYLKIFDEIDNPFN